jgi:hypothetical protein
MKSAEDRDLFPGALEMMILQTLKRSPMHGYALAKHIKQSSECLLQIEEGSLYPALQRMLKVGWLQAECRLSATNCKVRLSGSQSREPSTCRTKFLRLSAC